MKRRIAFFVLLALALMPSIGRADVDAGAGAYFYAGISFDTATSWVYVNVEQGAGSGGATQTGFAYVYDVVRDRVVCNAQWQLAPGEFVIDPTLSTARLNAPRTSCGAMTITWNATGVPAVPSSYVYAYQHEAHYAGAGTDGYTGRAARATGTVGTRTIPPSNWGWLESGYCAYEWTTA